MSIQVTESMKAKFCKDMNIPISIYAEPYFGERLALYDRYKPCISDYEGFLKEVEKEASFDDFLKKYNIFKDNVINDLWSKEGIYKLINEDYTKFTPKYVNFNKKDIYKQTNIGKYFVSIDMQKANFNALKCYDSTIVDGKETYEDYVSKFIDSDYLKKCKYIRQVIFGNVNTKRIIMYERYLTDKILDVLLNFVDAEAIAFVGNDEIVIDVTSNLTNLDKLYTKLLDFYEAIYKTYGGNFVPLTIEVFKLRMYKNQFDAVVYLKEIDYTLKHKKNECEKGLVTLDVRFKKENSFETINKEKGIVAGVLESSVDFKCVTREDLPFVLCKYFGETPRDNDAYFVKDGRLCKFIDIPVFETDYAFG